MAHSICIKQNTQQSKSEVFVERKGARIASSRRSLFCRDLQQSYFSNDRMKKTTKARKNHQHKSFVKGEKSKRAHILLSAPRGTHRIEPPRKAARTPNKSSRSPAVNSERTPSLARWESNVRRCGETVASALASRSATPNARICSRVGW